MIKIVDIRKTYQLNGLKVAALAGVSLDIDKGSFMALMGPSGSGKTTLMNIIGCLDTPSGGDYFLDGRNFLDPQKMMSAGLHYGSIGRLSTKVTQPV